MRNIYIALIFIGCLSLALAAEPAPFVPITRPVAVACTDATPVDGCTECVVDQSNPPVATCKTSAFGYYIDSTNQAKNCPKACTECKADTVATNPPICTQCQNTTGFVDYVAESTISGCILCKTGYSFDNGNTDAEQATNQNGMCISVSSNQYTCVTNYFWDSLPNPDRKCILNTANCDEGFTTNTGSTVASSDCSQCAQSFKQIIGLTTDGNNNKYWAYGCQTYTAPTPRKPAQQCTGGTEVDGCATCTAGKCILAAPGYFIDTTSSQAVACSQQCSECTAANVCTKCPSGENPNADNNCDCDENEVPNIEKSLTKNAANSFTCVSYLEGAPCATNYAWNTGVALNDNEDYECISIYGTGKCFVDPSIIPSSFKLTSFWNAPINPNTASNRQCVLRTQGNCLPGYSVDGTITSQIAGDCVKCAADYPQFSGVGIDGSNKYYSYNNLCQKQTPLPIRAVPVACAGAATSSVGCKTCAAGTCSVAEDGYYILNGQPAACLSQCGTCTGLTACTTCPANSKLDGTNNCVCNTGYVPSIEKKLTSTISNQFYCVNQLMNYPCSQNFVWNTQSILFDSASSECLSVYGSGICYVDPAQNPTTLVQTSYWNAPVNPNTVGSRQCVLKNSGDCQTGYSFDGTLITKITGDCKQCAAGYPTPLSGVGIDGTNTYYSFDNLCQKQNPLPTRPTPVNCTGAATSSIGCKTCAAGTCSAAEDGYYILNNQPTTCLSQCGTCTDLTACTGCPANSKLDDTTNNCVCSEGYVPSIEKAESFIIPNQFYCVKQLLNYPCSDNYIWNAPTILAKPSESQCINKFGNSQCYTNKDTTVPAQYDQTSYWNAPINPTTAPTRGCVLSGSGTCEPNYATAANSIANITADCFSCVDKYTLLSGVSQTNGITYNMQVCSEIQVLKPRALPGNCTQGKEDPVTGCLKCDSATGLCTQPQEGYYLAQTKRRLRNLQDTEGTGGIPTACPQQCKSCNGNTACTGCYDDVKPVADNCPCPDSFTPSIDESLTKNVSNSYFCVNQFQGYPCSESNVWNSPSVLLDQTKSKCVGIFTNSSCFKEPAGTTPKIDQTCYWNSAKVKTRQCVLATGKSCANNSAQNPGDNSSSYPEPLTKNCDSCINNLVLANSENDQVCLVPSSSSRILQLSVLILSVLMGIFLF